MSSPATCYDSSFCAASASVKRDWPIVSRLWHWRSFVMHQAQLRRERIQLQELSDHQLRDIGLTREQARSEGRRRYWDDLGWWR
ncbi:DUF1127 domain-containing protein [Billgrantia diversa]|uniref:DUF1127 domain-containing protein n=1 Tax=Halomonas sp. MCCC 1A13316 TaxID=2733487 RepID=UPI001E352527|nr:DUF1127 domain-containing protein [Halomonas sp. MCCC 1A13316]